MPKFFQRHFLKKFQKSAYFFWKRSLPKIFLEVSKIWPMICCFSTRVAAACLMLMLCLNVMAETHTLSDSDLPLLERICLGPLEDFAKIFIVERQQTVDITGEVLIFFLVPVFFFAFLSVSTVDNISLVCRCNHLCCCVSFSSCSCLHFLQFEVVWPYDLNGSLQYFRFQYLCT